MSKGGIRTYNTQFTNFLKYIVKVYVNSFCPLPIHLYHVLEDIYSFKVFNGSIGKVGILMLSFNISVISSSFWVIAHSSIYFRGNWHMDRSLNLIMQPFIEIGAFTVKSTYPEYYPDRPTFT